MLSTDGSLSELELQERLVELRIQQAEQRWATSAQGADGTKKLESLLKRKLKSATKKVRKQSAHAMAIGKHAANASASALGTATSRLPYVAIQRHAQGEEIELDESVLAMEPPQGPSKRGIWKEGPLRKRPPERRGVQRGLQKRLCVLKVDGMYYYADTAMQQGSKAEEAKGKIPLVAMRSVVLSRTPDGPQIEIGVGTRNFVFVAADDETAHGWRLAIEAAREYRGAAASKRMRERLTSRAQRSDLAAQVVESSKLSTSRLSSRSHSASGASHGRQSSVDGADLSRKRLTLSSRKNSTLATNTLLSGWLQKQDASRLSSKFKARYWVLTTDSLNYYRTESLEEHLQMVRRLARARGPPTTWPSLPRPPQFLSLCQLPTPTPFTSRPGAAGARDRGHLGLWARHVQVRGRAARAYRLAHVQAARGDARADAALVPRDYEGEAGGGRGGRGGGSAWRPVLEPIRWAVGGLWWCLLQPIRRRA